MDDVMVTVCCITYNHAKYVRQCLDSLVGQKTDFLYEILIHDDASTDGTADIIREYMNKYPEMFVPILEEENQYSQGRRSILIQMMLKRARGKYFAVCEGDDFWCDPYKLQKQFKILETHEDCNICTHTVEVIKEDSSDYGMNIPERDIPYGVMEGQTLINYIAYEDTHLFHTSSMFCRKQPIEDEVEKLPDFMLATAAEDRVLFLLYGSKGNLFYLSETMSKYRIQSEGSWSSQNAGSRKRALRTDKDLLQMIRGFNEFTKGRFEEEAYAYETILNFRIFQNERKFKELLDGRYAKLFKNLGKKQKIYYRLCAYFPFVGDCYYKLKRDKSEDK